MNIHSFYVCCYTTRPYWNVWFVNIDIQAEGTVLVKPRTDVMIKCTSDYSPVHWYKNDKQITTNSDYRVDEENGTLIIYKAGI